MSDFFQRGCSLKHHVLNLFLMKTLSHLFLKFCGEITDDAYMEIEKDPALVVADHIVSWTSDHVFESYHASPLKWIVRGILGVSLILFSLWMSFYSGHFQMGARIGIFFIVFGISFFMLHLFEAMMHEIYERKCMEKRLAESEVNLNRQAVELQQSNQELAVSLNKLREINKLKSDFVAFASHEFKNPLMIMKASLDNLTTLELDPKQREKLFTICKNTIDRMNRLVSHYLDLSKIEAGQMEYHIIAQNISGVVAEVIQILNPQAKELGVEIENEIKGDSLKVLVDIDKCYQILMNLIHNSIKFTPKGGRIFLSQKEKNNFLEMSVRDTGIGISKEEQSHIFEKYKQGHASKNNGHYWGTGLGLSIVRSLVKAHGGEITLESEVAKGSCFTFTLPLAKEEEIKKAA